MVKVRLRIFLARDHVISEVFAAETLVDGASFVTAQSASVEIDVMNGTIMVNNARVEGIYLL
jgi:uncharacterized surface protein with fasciclin (FAS1) repeats